jgi:hypothetical protein
MATATPVRARTSKLRLRDPWLFGTATETPLRVEQSQLVKPVAPTLPPKKSAPGNRAGSASGSTVEENDPLAPRVAGTLEDGSAGVLVVPSPARVAAGRKPREPRMGEAVRPWGELLWMPHALSVGSGPAQDGGRAPYDEAVSSFLQPALVQLRPRGEAAPGPQTSDAVGGVRVALRASAKGTLLVGLFNTRPIARSLTLRAQSIAKTVVDLRSDKALEPRVRGLRAEVDLDLPARGWAILAFGAEAAALEQERFAARSRVRLR